jgi:Domain of unknown function (DUF4340)
MSARRVLLLLSAGILVILGSLWLASQRHLETATLVGDVVLPGLEKALNDVTEIHLAKGDGTRTTLKRRPGEWIVGERDYPADSGRVRKLLLDLGALRVVEEKTRNHELYAQLGVEDSDSPKAAGALVEVVTPAKTFDLIVGKPSSGKTGFVRVAHTQPSLLVQPLISVDADARRWIDRTVVDIGEQRVKEAIIESAAGPAYTATRLSPQQSDYQVAPVPKGRELSSAGAANGVSGALAALQADDVRRAPAAASDAAKPDHAIFRTFNGLELEVTGRLEGTHHYIALLARSTAKESQAEAEAINARLGGWQLELPSYKYEAMFTPLEQLLKKVEPPKPKGTKADTKKSSNAAPVEASPAEPSN